MDKGEKKKILTPRQVKFIKSYIEIESDTYGNAYQSALKAKYSENQARKIMGQMPEKVRVKIGEGISGEEVKARVIENLNWLILTLKDSAQRKEMGISVDNCIKSLELLGKWQKLFTDRVEVSGGITVVGYLPGEKGYCQPDQPAIDTQAVKIDSQ